MIGSLTLKAGEWAALGAALGVAHLAALGWNVRLYLSATRRAVLLHLTRWTLLSTVLIVLARHGAMPLLANFAGFLAARIVVLNQVTLAARK